MTTVLTYIRNVPGHRVSTGAPIIIIEVLSGFTRSLQVDDGIVPQIRTYSFLLHSFRFNTYVHQNIRCYMKGKAIPITGREGP
jgi:hypothetical protein